MSEYGIKIKNIHAGMLYDVNNGIRDYLTHTDAMLNNSLFSDYLKTIKVKGSKKKKALTICGKDKNEATRDLICIDFDYGSKSYDDEVKRVKKMIKEVDEGKPNGYDKETLEQLLEKIESNKDKYDKRSRDEIRNIYYKNSCSITYHDIDRENEGQTIDTTINYKMLFRTSAKAKLGQAIFINEILYDDAYDWLTMGLGKRMPKENAKIVELSAYAPLTTSNIINKIKIDVNDILILKDQDSLFKTMAKVVYAEEYEHMVNKKKVKSKKCAVKTEEVELKNTVWDGMALVESSVLPYYINGMALFRNHMFKACGVRTHIQRFFKDWCRDNGVNYDTFKIRDMFGKLHLAKDIKMITTDNAIKWKKFIDIMGGTPESAYKYWCSRIKKDGCYWGIVKTDHPSKLGSSQQMSYQMVNTLPCEKEDIGILAQESVKYVESLKFNPEEFEKYLRKNATAVNHYEMLADMHRWNKDFHNSRWFRNEKKKVIWNYVYRLRTGKITVHGDNLTIFGNPYALLLYSVGDDWESDPTLCQEDGCIQCYTPRFKDGEYLCGIRNPHNSPNNLMYLHNRYSKEYKKYFEFSNNIMAVNCLHTDIQDRSNGCDFDSDFFFVTDNPIMVKSSKIAYEKFPTIVNQLKESGLSYNSTPDEYAKMDNKFSKSRLGIGWSSNLAQLAMTYYWTEKAKDNPDENILKDLYDNFVILSVVAQLVIDSSKREYEIDGMEEIDRIQRMPCMNRYRNIETDDGKIKKIKYDFPLFMKYTRPIQTTKNGKSLPYSVINASKEKLSNRVDESLICPMNYLQEYLDKIQNMTTRDTIPTKEFFIKMDGYAHVGQSKKMIKLVKKYTEKLAQIRYDYRFDKELYAQEIELLTDNVIKIFSEANCKNKRTINRLIEISMHIEAEHHFSMKIESKYSINLLNLLYKSNQEKFLNNFIQS